MYFGDGNEVQVEGSTFTCKIVGYASYGHLLTMFDICSPNLSLVQITPLNVMVE